MGRRGASPACLCIGALRLPPPGCPPPPLRSPRLPPFSCCTSAFLCPHTRTQIEYHLIKLDGATRSTALALLAPELVAQLEAQDREAPAAFPISSAWRPEYGSWMVEATPGAPYGGDTAALRTVEANMAMRRYRIAALCPPGVAPFSIVAYPLLGATGVAFTDPPLPPGGPFSRSAYIPDACISPHPRFGCVASAAARRLGRARGWWWWWWWWWWWRCCCAARHLISCLVSAPRALPLSRPLPSAR